MIKIKAYANCDHSYVVWRADKPIRDCLGFALYRRPKGKSPEIVKTFVGPADGPRVPAGTSRASTEWPIQKFMWADYLAGTGDDLQYQVVAMCGSDFAQMKESVDEQSDWSNEVTLATSNKSPIRAFFNRGVVSTQWVAQQLKLEKGKSLKDLVEPALGRTSKVRDFLGGVLKEDFLNLLAERQKAGAHIYASLFELSDPEVIPALLRFGQRAHIILSDGTHKAPAAKDGKKKGKAGTAAKGKPFDENAYARGLLRQGHVELHDRMVTGNHFAHHKFIVFTDPGKPTSAELVWTGSTNLTYGGVCTQANNGILLEDKKIAGRFLAQWRELVKDVGSYPSSLAKFDAQPVANKLGGATVTAWFAPNPKIGAGAKNAKGKDPYGEHPDLKFARRFIQNAKEGVLFLFLNPGPRGTLLNDVMALVNNQRKNAALYVHGVVNQDPTTKGTPSIIFVHQNNREPAPRDIAPAVLLPSAIDVSSSLSEKDKAAADALDKWVKLVEDYWQTEPTGLGVVRVHSKVVLIDPFGKNPVVMTGSHNAGPKASMMNDDNLVIIENAPDIAMQYAVNIITVYNQYRWRFQQLMAAKNHQSLNQWNGLQAPWKSQPSYFVGDKKKELDFWM